MPAEGPHGFHSLGRSVSFDFSDVRSSSHPRIIESTMRTMNNLLERLHASFFFYILTTSSTFLKIGHYLPSAILISVSMMFGGLRQWTDAGWRRRQPNDASSEDKVDSPDEWLSQHRDVIRLKLRRKLSPKTPLPPWRNGLYIQTDPLSEG